jgi:amylosucrase
MKRYISQFQSLYQHNGYLDPKEALRRLEDVIEQAKQQRSPVLQAFDASSKGWYLSQSAIAYNLYVDLFSVDLKGLIKKIPFLKELGVTILHLMPILQGRPGENDGGYAVMDYRSIDASLGTMDDFQSLVKALRKEGMHVVIDFVINHTAKEHEWAQQALKGDTVHQALYLMFDDETIPNQFNKTVPEVFPGVAPGNFTYYPKIKKHVWTSFYEFQWDLNFKNPDVFIRIVDILLFMANLGVDMIRLDAIPFMWKELGHTCRNHPTIHILLDMLHQIVEDVAPAVVLLGEAIVEPEEIVKYFGVHQQECDVMYNATFMVNLWNAIATKDAQLLRIDQTRLQPHGQGAWISYARCHDDIGWGFNEEAIKHMGLDPFAHKQFLISFYEGTHPYSFSKGELYEFNPITMDARNSGRLASLVGLEQALEQNDAYQKELAIKRIHLIHAMLFSSRGIPFIYSGDEIATLNDHSYKEDAKKKHDSRWVHRSRFDWKAAKKRHDPTSVVGQVFQTLQWMSRTRSSLSILKNNIKEAYPNPFNPHVFITKRQTGKTLFIGLFNVSDHPQFIEPKKVFPTLPTHRFKDVFQGTIKQLDADSLVLGPYEYYWLISSK